MQSEPATLRVRLLISPVPTPRRSGARSRGAQAFLDRHGLAAVALERAEEPPARSDGGKLRKFIPLLRGAPDAPASKSRYVEGQPERKPAR